MQWRSVSATTDNSHFPQNKIPAKCEVKGEAAAKVGAVISIFIYSSFNYASSIWGHRPSNEWNEVVLRPGRTEENNEKPRSG